MNDAPARQDAGFDRLHSAEERPSIAPERLIRSSLMQALFPVQAQRHVMEQMQ